jgi:hypothetical protein
LLETLIGELNRTWSMTLGVVFELLRWETHVRPAFGSDPQSIVNEQIGNSYDVFIGILWGRFGTPTPRAASGTIEEFERALMRRTNDGRGPEIMFYFKDAPLPPSKIDTTQLKLVQDFRASLANKGGLYTMFEDHSGFQTSLRAHLAALAQKFAAAPTVDVTTRRPVPSGAGAERSDADEDDLGYLDYVEIYESRMAELTSTLTIISDATGRIGQLMHQRSEEVQQLTKLPPDSKTARRLVKRAAEDMDAYADILKKQLPVMSSSREAALQALTMALTLHEDFNQADNSDLEKLRDSLSGMHEATEGSARSLSGFRDSIRGLPRMTSDLNRAKRAVLGQLDAMLTELDSTGYTIGSILKSIDRILRNGPHVAT